MADRPRNYCRDCGHQWLPRGSERAARCPGCRGANVAPVLSLDDAEPAPPAGSSAAPMFLALGILGLGVLTAGGLAVYLLRDDPAPRPVEVVAAKATAPAPNPTPAPPVTPKDPEPQPPAPSPKVTPKPKEPPAPVVPDPPAPPPMPKPPEPAPKPPEPAPKTPAPPERAPSPFPPPAGSWVSAWEKAGDVRIRVAGVALTKVPLEARKRKFLSPEPYFVVWVEVENTSKTDRTYRRWQPVTTGECTLRYASGAAVGYPIYPPESGREWFTEFAQPLPAGAPPLLESLAFSRPEPSSDGPLTLTLDAARAGGTGRVAIEIPHAVWARK
jgi:hypothetical protein